MWLFFVSALSSRGASLLSGKKYRICMILVNLTLVYFGVSFVVDAF